MLAMRTSEVTFSLGWLCEKLLSALGGSARMKRNLIRVDGDDFIGWCCSLCEWDMTAPRLDSTAGALALNRVAQKKFEKHNCTVGTSS
jgi:hypothetical protein